MEVSPQTSGLSKSLLPIDHRIAGDHRIARDHRITDGDHRKVRTLQLFLLKEKQRKCIDISYFRIQLSV